MSDEPVIFDDRICGLGEGPLWHPTRQKLYWVDIPNKTILAKGGSSSALLRFDEIFSALGWVDENHLFAASETGLYKMHADTGSRELVCAVEAELTSNRSNDGRTDPWGGFWIGTMSKNAEAGAGSVYRWYKGELRTVTTGMTVTNGTCFDKDRGLAYFVDSARKLMFRVKLDDNGWSLGEPEIFMDTGKSNETIDGAIVDTKGHIWAAMWEGSAVAEYSPEGKKMGDIPTHTPLTTCPAFGGPEGQDLYVTTASVGMKNTPATSVPHGTTLLYKNAVSGVLEPKVLIND